MAPHAPDLAAHHRGRLRSWWQLGTASSRFAHVDALRAFAVMLVVVSHAGLQAVVPGGAGVTVFLVISGFIITYLVIRERLSTGGFSPRRFYLRRVLKIGPPLLVIILLPTAVYAALGGPVAPGAVASQIFFSYNWVHLYGYDAGGVLPGSAVLWSLSVEEQFYIVFAVYWVLASRTRHFVRSAALFGVVAIVASSLSRVLVSLAPGDGADRINYGTDTRMESLGWGILVAVVYVVWQQDGRRLPRLRAVVQHPSTPVLAATLFVASLLVREEWFRDTIRYTIQSLSASAFILFGLLARGRLQAAVTRVARWGPVRLIGLASYSLYLVHHAVDFALDAALGVEVRPSTAPLYILAGVVCGIVVYRVLEVPFEHLRARLHRTDAELPGRGLPRPTAEASRAPLPARPVAPLGVPGPPAPRTGLSGAAAPLVDEHRR
ncbi:Peptidoglycan/LPS O-acetylase OafA/YrhL, contains acyltransferase and SGNH-hydrolase domains [Friedmanniella luteola]|uniref:Peptidoglycan/LPS O-acetylase OafA/YrhL, contains acyltransferase and SGNH-hydrolase domains n=1 Tax=Friedmanniella luteola TaxID=546871 RepID=A0A1H1PYD7_9ACTN|nr:acyltransferase [Friedmanniella luteola]SDS16208.1 Peptidoglycan/LPS O-acetylase OafA/YrhL, contains acyltransferase and SGNH-hydrolase domains [Friedmanniella luteola]